MKMLKTIETVREREREREHNFNKLSFTYDAQIIVLVGIKKAYFNSIIINKKDRLYSNKRTAV